AGKTRGTRAAKEKKIEKVLKKTWSVPYLLLTIWTSVMKKTITLIMTIVLIFSLSIKLHAKKNNYNLKFDHLTSEDGLSGLHIPSIIQDSMGFMWFASECGLNKFNGYKMTLFKHDHKNINSLSDSGITKLYEDDTGTLWIGSIRGLNQYERKSGNFKWYIHDDNNLNSLVADQVRDILKDRNGVLWIATLNGVSQFDRKTDTFTNFQHFEQNPHSLSSNQVWVLYEDSQQSLWLGTSQGLNRYNPQNKTFEHYQDKSDSQSLSHNVVRAIYEDNEGVFWIGTDGGGLNRFDRKTGKFVHFQHDLNTHDSLSSNSVKFIFEDSKGRFWIGTTDNGLNLFDRASETFVHYKCDPDNRYSLSESTAISIFEDRSGTLWIGTMGGGVNKLDYYAKNFIHYQKNPNDPFSLSSNNIRGMHEDSLGIIWIALIDGGLNRFNPKTEQFTQYLPNINNPLNSLSHINVTRIYEDKTGVLWIGTWGGGLNRFNRETETFSHFKYNKNNPLGISHNLILTICEDSFDNLWIATWGGGLNKFDRKSGTFIHYQHDENNSNSLANNRVHDIYPDSNGTLWVSVIGRGLDKFVPESETFLHYQNEEDNPDSLIHNSIRVIHKDRHRNLWLGTVDGLDKFDPTLETFHHYTQKDGLSDNSVYGILEDDQGNLWISTNNGLSQLNPKTRIFKNYDVKDGLQGRAFNYMSYLKSSTGELYFGGRNGLNRFHPDELIENPYIPPVVLIDFKLFHNSVSPGPDSPLNEHINYVKEIVLTHKQSVFTIEFAALNYTNPEKNQYAYIMEGFDNDWIFTSSQNRRATYTNLSSGTYTFRVKASNNDGVWNEKGTYVKIIIIPPWWKTWWFICTVTILLIVLFWSGYQFRIKNIKDRSIKLEKTVKNRTTELRKVNQKLQQEIYERKKAEKEILIAKDEAESANQAKSQFLANMSHEIRTPINAMSGFSQMLKGQYFGKLNETQIEYLDHIIESTNRLLSLINDILDLSKVEAGKIEIINDMINIEHLMVRITNVLSGLIATNKALNSKVIISPNVPKHIIGDDLRIEQVLKNLVSNAVKFTQQGIIEILVNTESENELIFEVKDTGMGIPKDKIDKLFEKFYQVDSSYSKTFQGTGLGLAISKQLVNLMGGKIWAKSEVGIGSSFYFTLKFDIPKNDTTFVDQKDSIFIEEINFKSRLKILLAEDDDLSSKMITYFFKKKGHEVTRAINGNEVLSLLKTDVFDIILMDIQMPEMDGVKTTKQIRTASTDSFDTNIPIIALTAYAMRDDEKKFINAGMNDYITKPVEIDTLLYKIAKLLAHKI
ncbi:chemotaxis protein CheY, partial [Candidatus Magnetomorum sp. HK-1]